YRRVGLRRHLEGVVFEELPDRRADRGRAADVPQARAAVHRKPVLLRDSGLPQRALDREVEEHHVYTWRAVGGHGRGYIARILGRGGGIERESAHRGEPAGERRRGGD